MPGRVQEFDGDAADVDGAGAAVGAEVVVGEAGDLLLEEIRRAVRSRVTLVPTDQIEIVLAELGSYAGAVGAALAGALAG